jgi:hypothetical protein
MLSIESDRCAIFWDAMMWMTQSRLYRDSAAMLS